MRLAADELQVWSVSLIGTGETIAAFDEMLSAAEIDRCRRFYHEGDRRAFTLSHGVLRLLLSSYLQIPPQQIAFRYGPAGKPELDCAHACLEFNMSHSGGLAVYGFAKGCRLGVDVERIRPMPDLESVAAHFFSREECGELLDLSPAERTEAFFRCWTRKEAYIKAIGEGLSKRLQSFRVSLAQGEPAALLYAEEESASGWQMHHFLPDAQAIGAVAYEGGPRSVRERPLSEAGEFLKRLAPN